jgi:CO/xanthine dehydrogenase FAD-binding subunit
VFEETAHTAQGDLGRPSDLHGTAAYRRHVAGVLIGASYRAVAGVLSP